jgi:site-specific recombinase XerD
VKGYEEGIARALKIMGNITPQEISQQHLLALRSDLATKAVGQYWTRAIILAVRSFLKFCQEAAGLQVLDPKSIALPHVQMREVVYLTPEEVGQFLAAIPVYGKNGRIRLRWLTFRSLVEVLLGTGMRVSEVLSIERSSLRLETGEAKIVGKGSRERTVFFTPRALAWTKEYLNRRKDSGALLFVQPNGRPLGYDTVRSWFRTVRRLSGLQTKVTAHMLRHTCATILLFNGCPMGHIKEILGHRRLITTCQYYLGVNKEAAKEAHTKYLRF